MAKEKDRHKNPSYNQDYKRANYESITLQYNREKRYKERIRPFADDAGLSVAAWIFRAIENQLRRDSGEDYGEE